MKSFRSLATSLFRVGSAILVASVFPVASSAAVEPAPDPPSSAPLPVRPPLAVLQEQDGKPVREISASGYRLKIDLAPQVLRLSAPDEVNWRTAEERLRPGDLVELTKASPLASGRQTLLTLPQGRRIRIGELRGKWARTTVFSEGKARSGWLPAEGLKFLSTEPPLAKTPLEASSDPFVSASILAQKAKQFDDGLYAAVELAAQQGAGELGGKAELLKTLSLALASQATEPGSPAAIVAGACKLGGGKIEATPAVQQTIDAFLSNPLVSKPIGFYTWSRELKAIFQQDRLLQTELAGRKQIEQLVRILQEDSRARKTYSDQLELAARLTNPLTKPDLRQAMAALEKDDAAAPSSGIYFLPPSRSHETDLVMKLFGASAIPEGFELFAELIARIRTGQLDLSPTERSGWYDYQTWALAPLVLPDKTAEAPRLQLDESYRKQLEQLFRGVFALNRETHVKQLDFPAPAAAEGGDQPVPKVDLFVHPQLSAEPLAEHYLRRAAGYRFVRGVLEKAFGEQVLGKMHRQTADGPVALSLADELSEMESLFVGACATACWQLGMEAAGNDRLPIANNGREQADRFLSWGANLHRDADLGRDVRMMVPVFFDRGRGKTKAWVFLGWEARRVEIAFASPPAVAVLDADGKPASSDAYNLYFPSISYSLAYPVTAEIYVSRLLDRDEFRRHCDTYVSKSAILSNLQ